MDKRLRILILEDVPSDAELMERELRKAKLCFSTQRVETKEAFVSALEEYRPHLILADYSLPSFDGLSALALSQEKFPDTPFIFVSGTIGEEKAIEALKKGVTDYVLKDHLSLLVPTVSRALKECEERAKRRRAEEAMRIKDSAIASSISGIAFADLEGRLSYVNPSFLSLWGYAQEEEVLGKPVLDFWESKDGAAEVLEALHQKGTCMGELVARRKDGSPFDVELAANLVRDGGGKPICLMASFIDITQHKRMEKTLRESERRFRELADLLPQTVFEMDPQGRLLFANRHGLTSYGYTQEDLERGVNVFQLFISEDKERVKENILCILRGEKPTRNEYTALRKDGSTFPVLLYSNPTIRDNKPIGLRGVFIDITERKEAEIARENMQTQLLQAQKMEAIGTLTGGVAHDFNNILTAILGYTELALMEVEETNPLHRDLKQIHSAGIRASKLTQQLLLFSRRHPMEFTSLNLNQTVGNLKKMLLRLIGEDIAIETHLSPDIWSTQADEARIEQVVMNLAVNARDAMPNGGRLTITTDNVHLDEAYCKDYRYARPGRFVCLSVQDTGVGMNQETIKHIFEPFFSTKGPARGTGLGLSVVYGIVKEHKGWINVYSELHQGSMFKVYLPAVSGEAESKMEETVSSPEPRGSGERVLLVEDEETVRTLAVRTLREHDYVVFEAANVKEALEIFEREKRDFDLIFSDVVLPDGSVLELIDSFLSRKPELSVLLCSGYTDRKSQWRLVQQRKFPYLQKPYSLPNLLRAIKEALRRP